MSSDIPRLSNKESEILKVLITHGGERYGLEIIEKSSNKLKLGTLYTTLARMEEKGFIESRKEKRRKGARGLPRTMYKCTGLGQKVFEVWEYSVSALSPEYS